MTTLAALAVLLALGFWQLDRREGKHLLLTAISHAEASPPVPLSANASPLMLPPFAKVVAEGVFRHAGAAYYGAEVRSTRAGPKMGAHVIVPLEMEKGPPVLVDRGWAPVDAAGQLDQPTDRVRIEGYVRPPEPRRWFAAKDDPATRRFYTLDPATIGAAIGLPQVMGFVLVAMGPARDQITPDKFPDPAWRMPRPANDHLSYAITWFSLAGTLAVIFAIFARKVLHP